MLTDKQIDDACKCTGYLCLYCSMTTKPTDCVEILAKELQESRKKVDELQSILGRMTTGA
jgi:hypothetical protein